MESSGEVWAEGSYSTNLKLDCDTAFNCGEGPFAASFPLEEVKTSSCSGFKLHFLTGHRSHSYLFLSKAIAIWVLKIYYSNLRLGSQSRRIKEDPVRPRSFGFK